MNENIHQEYLKNIEDYEKIDVKIENILNNDQIQMIDNKILSIVTKDWSKVAFVIGRVLNRLKEQQVFSKYADCSDILIAQRIKALAETNHLKSQGNLKAIRFSEIKL